MRRSRSADPEGPELRGTYEVLRVVRSVGVLSIFEVRDNEQLHEILWGLPLFPYMTMQVTPLATHPSDIHA